MKILKDDFRQGQPSSSVGADWFNAVAKFVNKLTGANGIRVNRESEFPTIMIDSSVSAMGTPVDNTAASAQAASEPFGLAFTNWASGGDNGLVIRAYLLVEEFGGGSAHILQPVDIAITASGMVKSVSVPQGDNGIFING